MSYIPEDAEWYIAELVMEITVTGARRNVVHRNLFLIKAHLPIDAYEKAVEKGHEEETEYENPKGQHVTIRFRGVSKLDVVHEPLDDGVEIAFEEEIGVTESEIIAMIPGRNKLAAFVPPRPGGKHDPDYSSKEVMDMVAKMMLDERKKSRKAARSTQQPRRLQG